MVCGFWLGLALKRVRKEAKRKQKESKKKTKRSHLWLVLSLFNYLGVLSVKKCMAAILLYFCRLNDSEVRRSLNFAFVFSFLTWKAVKSFERSMKSSQSCGLWVLVRVSSEEG